MKMSSVVVFFSLLVTLVAVGEAQPPTMAPPITLPPGFKCPKNLKFAFECRCYFNRIGEFEIFDFEEEACAARLAAIQAKPGLGRRIAKTCERTFRFLGEITGPRLRGTEDQVFKECPKVLEKLCPSNPAYKVLECTCFLVQIGEIIPEDPAFLTQCNNDWGEVTRENRRIRRRRCIVSIKFSDFLGSILGLTGRQCFTNDATNCCNALPTPRPQPPSA